MSKANIGSGIDDFLDQEGILEDARAHVINEVAEWKLAETVKRNTEVEEDVV